MSSFTHYRVHHEEQVPVLAGTSDEDLSVDFASKLLANLEIDIISLNEEDIMFDLIGADVSIANALRRIMLAEVPTMAIEWVWMKDNTSVIQDEVLCHRIGLVPILADPSEFDMWVNGSDVTKATDLNSIVMNLEVKRDETEGGPDTVYSGDLKWQPVGDQIDKFGENGIRPVHADIPLAKLHGTNRINLEAHCHKGIGKDHSKYSPCATASYRLMPDIRFGAPVQGALAHELKRRLRRARARV